ncbi:adenylate kinase [Actinomadura verrucosospora]|uniref:Adenylate kinase n=1 Tax=Actinomadura verrucosospora TaxID=46165 RepID=A0A7D3VY76_ACTVE|nr:adenylate kinase [Actinomadura verrucosospora]QKG21896.1 adenylate kinase [Actinomadura verrucosospora]
MERVLVGGITESGKTTMATRIGARRALPRHELDALHHGPNWQPRQEFRADVERIAEGPRWVTEDQYRTLLGDLLTSRADTYVWLDLPHRTVMFRVLRRSLYRTLTARRLWNGNRETFRNWFDATHPARWAWTQHAARRQRIQGTLRDNPHLAVVHLTSARAARAWARSLEADGARALDA